MAHKACRHSAFKIKRFVPRNRWEFPRSSATTGIMGVVIVSNEKVFERSILYIYIYIYKLYGLGFVESGSPKLISCALFETFRHFVSIVTS